MDFTNRSAQQPAAKPAAVGHNGGGGSKNSGWKSSPMWLRVIWIVLLFSATALAVAMVALLYFGGPKESEYVKEDGVQAVFLTNGQVYFGDIGAINDKYIDLQNIYYLSVDQKVQPKEGQQSSSVQLVKLGCELHGPLDQMVINREQVTFWENLKSDGKVAEAIQEWMDKNPDGQNNCDEPSSADTDATKSE